MGQHAQRFDAVGAQRGSGLHAVVTSLKVTAETIEQYYDPNDRAVVAAIQLFEQGLARLTTAEPKAAGSPASDEQKPEPVNAEKPEPVKPATRRGGKKPAEDDASE